MSDTIRWDSDSEGIVTLTLDDPGRSANTINEGYRRSFDTVLDRLEASRDTVTGVVVTSAKTTFLAGANLDDLIRVTRDQAGQIAAEADHVKAQLRRLETLGRPVVAALNGSALGGGLELALACHHRIVLDDTRSDDTRSDDARSDDTRIDDTRIELGFPEVTLGLLPGGGGVVRSVRLLGIAEALTRLLLRGQRLRPAAALELGLVDALASDRESLVAQAKQWIRTHPDAAARWDTTGYRIPGGTPAQPSFAANLPAFPATLRKELKGAPYPAPRNILCAAVEGAQVDLATAFAIETRYFVELVVGQVAKNMTQAFFFDLRAANSRPAPAGHLPHPGTPHPVTPHPVTPRPVTKVGVLGAGMMGAGIAYVCAKAGMEVVLKDVTVEAAVTGKGYSEALLGNAVSRGHATAASAAAQLRRITPTADPADLAGCDLVIEAVFEDAAVKHQVFAEIEDVVDGDALLCSNTSTLPITLLAQGVRRPENFVGLHFFSPVDKMPLIEVIRGGQTSDEALARALDVVRQLRKTPIVVNDSRGFFTSRVIGTFTGEGLAMLAEGIPAASIEQASAQAGYPTPVLALLDELTLTLPRRIRAEAAAAVLDAGGEWTPSPADAVLDTMVEQHGRTGRAGGAGFYEYADGRRTGLWPGLATAFHPAAAFGSAGRDTGRDTGRDGPGVPLVDLQERMLFAEALEAVKCLDEGVLTTVLDANIGSLLGIGYPGWTGGVLRYINQYSGGLPGFVARAQELTARYGERFEPPALLLDMARRHEVFT